MALLQYLVPTLATLLIGVFGFFGPQMEAAHIQSAWLTFFTVSVFTMSFDRSRGRWLSCALFLFLSILTAGLYINSTNNFMSWFVGTFTATSLIIMTTQLGLNMWMRFSIITVALAISFMPAILATPEAIEFELTYTVPSIAIVLSLLPFLFQYAKTFRAEIIWPILSLQQFILRLCIVVWAFSGEYTATTTDLTNSLRTPMLTIICLLLLVTNIRSARLSWAHVSQTVYSLIIVYVALFKVPETATLLYLLIGIIAYGSIFPIRSSVVRRGAQDLAALEIGAFGSAGFFIALWSLFKIKSKIEVYEFILWSLFLIVSTSKVWSQTDIEKTFGRACEESSRRYFYGRMAIQIMAVGTVLVILFGHKLGLT